VFSISRNVNRCFGGNTSRCTDVIHRGAAEITVDDRMLTIRGEPAELLAEAVTVGADENDLTARVDAHRRLGPSSTRRGGLPA